MRDDGDDTMPPALAEGLPLPAVLEKHFARVREWQRTREGVEARARWERAKLAKARAEREELCALRGVPEDIDVRRWALEPHPSGGLFDALREAVAWQREQSEQTGGSVPVVRFLVGAPGTGKTSALAWLVATWPRRARYVTADELCRSPDPAWSDAASVSLLALDELGIESHPDRVTELLLRRWSRGGLTVCGTNLSLREIQARYAQTAGARLLDRLRSQHARGLRPSVVASWGSLRAGGEQ